MPSIAENIKMRYKKKLKTRMLNKLGDSPISKRVKKFLNNFDEYKKDFHSKWSASKTKKGGRRRKTRRRKTRRRKTRRRKTRRKK